MITTIGTPLSPAAVAALRHRVDDGAGSWIVDDGVPAPIRDELYYAGIIYHRADYPAWMAVTPLYEEHAAFARLVQTGRLLILPTEVSPGYLEPGETTNCRWIVRSRTINGSAYNLVVDDPLAEATAVGRITYDFGWPRIYRAHYTPSAGWVRAGEDVA